MNSKRRHQPDEPTFAGREKKEELMRKLELDDDELERARSHQSLKTKPTNVPRRYPMATAKEFEQWITAAEQAATDLQEIIQKLRRTSNNYNDEITSGYLPRWLELSCLSRFDEFLADRLRHLGSGSNKSLGRSGFEPLKA